MLELIMSSSCESLTAQYVQNDDCNAKHKFQYFLLETLLHFLKGEKN